MVSRVIKNKLNNIKTAQEHNEFLANVQSSKINAVFGGRYYVYIDSQTGKKYGKIKLNDLVKVLHRITKNETDEENDSSEILKALCRIKKLNREGNDRLTEANSFAKYATRIKRWYNYFYDRDTVLTEIEFPGKLATGATDPRLLKLRGEKGRVVCRIWDPKAAYILPAKTEEGTIECGWRSYERMRHLAAVRGDKPGSRMIGPCDYYGNLEKPDEYLYTIAFNDEGVPLFFRHEIAAQEEVDEVTTDFSTMTALVNVKWHKGSDSATKELKKAYQSEDQKTVGESLFPNAGILEVLDSQHITLPSFDARKVDLSPFKAHIVKNDVPFQIIDEKLPAVDEFRVVSYLYEEGYANMQVTTGGGLFLESHAFAQTMTPAHPDCKGFVTLARWVDEEQTQLEIIGVEIPFGYTLVVDPFCIHGDTDLSGKYIMCMTSNHVTMQTADTVFLKYPQNKKNITIAIEHDSEESEKDQAEETFELDPPIVVFDNDDKAERKKFRKKVAFKRLYTPRYTFVKN